jgi:hypothetical protein
MERHHLASKHTKRTGDHAKPARTQWPVVVYVWIAGLGFVSYLTARIVLDGQPHPLHWAYGLAGAVVGYFVGWLWYRWRGDVN